MSRLSINDVTPSWVAAEVAEVLHLPRRLSAVPGHWTAEEASAELARRHVLYTEGFVAGLAAARADTDTVPNGVEQDPDGTPTLAVTRSRAHLTLLVASDD